VSKCSTFCVQSFDIGPFRFRCRIKNMGIRDSNSSWKAI